MLHVHTWSVRPKAHRAQPVAAVMVCQTAAHRVALNQWPLRFGRCSSGADDWADVLRCADQVKGWEVRDMAEAQLLRALGTADSATDVLIVSDIVFAEQLASVHACRSAVHAHVQSIAAAPSA